VATNVSSQYAAAIRRQLDKEVLPLTIRYLVGYQFADKKKMEKGAGVTWTATRFNRLPLPAAPLAEGVPPTGETLNISQVTGVALQWGDKVTLTDVAETTTLYDLVQQAKRLLAIQMKEMTERNTFALLASGTQVNYANSRGSRALLVAGDVLDTATINRTYADLENLGAPFYNGQMQPNVQRSIEHGASASEKSPKSSEHYVAITGPFQEQDLRQNPTIVQAWSYSDVNRLYINEIGYWGGIHFTKSNMLPRWTGVAQVNGTPGAAGSLAGGNYLIQVTANDLLNQLGETLIYQVSANIVVGGGGTGSISVTVPSTAGYLYNVYITQPGSTTVANLALTSSASAQTTGPLAGQAAILPAGTTAVLTGIGLVQIPPAAPATGITVYPTFVFGQGYFACLQLEGAKWTFLGEADKSDVLNQLRVIGWKIFEGFVILNQQFGCRIETSVSNSGTFG
jgi:N4-gp56 family major capsid protein